MERELHDKMASARSILFLGADAAYLFAFRSALMGAFRDKGYRVIACATVLGDFDPARFDEIGVEFKPWSVAKASIDPLADLRAALQLWRLLSSENPTILFAHTIKAVIFGLVLARLAGVPRRTAMIPGLGYAFTPGTGLKRRLVRLAARAGYRVALSGAQMVIFQNPDDRALLLAIGALPSSVPTELVNGSGVDMSQYVPLPPAAGPPTFLMVARLLRDKGVYEYVEAARIVRRAIPLARFVLVGAADSNPAAVPQSAVDGWVAEGLIEAHGHLPDPRPAYAACHVFVLPSYREGTPRTNLEAMAMARPVITTAVPGCRQTVEDGITGLLVPARDVERLAAAMIALGQAPNRRREMAAAGLALCRDTFELNVVTRATAALIQGLDEPS